MTQAFLTFLLIYSVLIVELHLSAQYSVKLNRRLKSRQIMSIMTIPAWRTWQPGIQNCVGMLCECGHLVIKQYVLDTDRVNSVMTSNLHNVGWYNLADLDTDRLNSVMTINQCGLVQCWWLGYWQTEQCDVYKSVWVGTMLMIWILTDWTVRHLELNIMWTGTIQQPPKCLHKFNQINVQVCFVVSLTKFHFYMFNVCVLSCHWQNFIFTQV